MSGPANFYIEILPWPAGQSGGPVLPVDVTDDVPLEDLGSINRAVERDFLSFRTGEVTLGLINDDGKFDDLFSLLEPTDRWQLRMFRRGRIVFLGIITGQGSITFDHLGKMVELTAYGATKVLDEASAESIKRTVADMTVTTATSGQAQITLNSTAGLLTGDVLHVTDHVNSEDLTVKQVTSATVAQLEAVLGHTYASGSSVVLATPFYRYKTVDFLVRELFRAANVPVAEVKVSGSLFRRLAPTPVSLNGLSLANRPYTNPAERGARVYVTEETTGTYYQPTPDADWTLEDATVRPWVDWSRYYLESEAAPTVFLRSHVTGEGTPSQIQHLCGFDYRPATKTVYFMDGGKIKLKTTADGTTWSADSDLVNLPAAFPSTASTSVGCELDPVRQYIYAYGDNGGANREFQVYDIAGAAFTDLKQADDTGKSYYAPVYVPELDAVLCLRSSTVTGPTFEIAAFRGKARLWVRSFPNVLIKSEGGERYTYPTHTLRHVAGSLYAVAISDGKAQFIRSDDQFLTYVMRALNNGGTARVFGARVLGAYRYFSYVGATPRGYGIAAPFYAGVVSYADYEGKTAAEGLLDLAILVKATFWNDDDFQGHFVARDQVPAGDIPDLTQRELLLEQGEVQLWDEARQHVTASGGGFEATAGDPSFAADSASISSPLIPNEAYAQALADDWLAFVSARRAMVPCTVVDEEDLQLYPMRRVFVDGRRFYVYESDQDAGNDEWGARLLEDLENQAVA